MIPTRSETNTQRPLVGPLGVLLRVLILGMLPFVGAITILTVRASSGVALLPRVLDALGFDSWLGAWLGGMEVGFSILTIASVTFFLSKLSVLKRDGHKIFFGSEGFSVTEVKHVFTVPLAGLAIFIVRGFLVITPAPLFGGRRNSLENQA